MPRKILDTIEVVSPVTGNLTTTHLYAVVEFARAQSGEWILHCDCTCFDCDGDGWATDSHTRPCDVCSGTGVVGESLWGDPHEVVICDDGTNDVTVAMLTAKYGCNDPYAISEAAQ